MAIFWCVFAAVMIFILSLKISVRVVLGTKEGIELQILALWFTIDVMGILRKSKAKNLRKEKKKKPEQKKEPPEEKKEKGLTFSDFLSLMDGSIERAKKVLKGFTKKFKIDRVFLEISYSTGDAPATAIASGAISAGVYPLLGRLDEAFWVKEKSISIRPDFEREPYFEGRFESITGMRVASGLVIGLRALWHFVIKGYLKYRKMKKIKEKAVG